MGQQSRASVSSGFLALPYNPVVRASTYGGLPGTTLNFYARDFAPGEVVRVYTGKGEGSQGELVSAFRVDQKGTAGAAGSYVIPGKAQGKLTFTLVGTKSEGTRFGDGERGEAGQPGRRAAAAEVRAAQGPPATEPAHGHDDRGYG